MLANMRAKWANIKQRKNKNEALSFLEGDTNFQELINIIKDVEDLRLDYDKKDEHFVFNIFSTYSPEDGELLYNLSIPEDMVLGKGMTDCKLVLQTNIEHECRLIISKNSQAVARVIIRPAGVTFDINKDVEFKKEELLSVSAVNKDNDPLFKNFSLLINMKITKE